MKSITAAAFAIAALALPHGLRAQGGAAYSSFGIGDFVESYGSAYQGMGGASIAVRSDYAQGGGLNPATLGFLTTTRLQVDFSLRQHLVEGLGGSTAQNNSSLLGIAAGLSIDTSRKISVGVGLRPLTRVAYSTAKLSSQFVDNQEVTARTVHTGSGGLSTLYLGASVGLPEDFIAGAEVRYNFGRMAQRSVTTFAGGSLLSSQVVDTDQMSSSGWSIGLSWQGIHKLSIGAVYGADGDLEINRSTLYQVSATRFDSTIESSAITAMPTFFGLGASYIFGNTMLTGEAVFRNFNGFNYRSGQGTAEFQSASRYTLGFAKMPSRDIEKNFFGNLGYSLGAGLINNYFSVRGQDIRDVYASLGLQIPIAGTSFLDASITAGIRGTVAQGMVEERYLRFAFSYSIGETWFKPFARQ